MGNDGQADELEILASIYAPHEVEIVPPATVRATCGPLVLSILLHPDYLAAPGVAGTPLAWTLSYVPCPGAAQSIEAKAAVQCDLALKFETLWQQSAGDPVLLAYIEEFRERAAAFAATDYPLQHSDSSRPETPVSPASASASHSAPVAEGSTKSLSTPSTPSIHFEHTTDPIVDRKSSFYAHMTAVHSMDDVEVARRTLLADRTIAKAHHNISAYVFRTPAGLTYQDYDDDGETQAGGRLLRMMTLAGVSDVFVMVSRYYGGIQLGPARFKHINDAARQLLGAHGYLKSSNRSS